MTDENATSVEAGAEAVKQHRAKQQAQATDEAERVRAVLEDWYRGVLADASDVSVGPLGAPGESGFSSETILVDLRYTRDGTVHEERHVVKSEPTGFRIFTEYDLNLQVQAMRTARAHDVPAPDVYWHEPDATVLGSPFYVMEAVEGEIPTDSPPYTIEGVLFDATDAQRDLAFRSALDAIAALHAIDTEATDLSFLDRGRFGTPGLEQELGYYENLMRWMAEGRQQPTLEPAFDWLVANQPDPGPNVFAWGDARFGNIIFRDFRPVALLDWEMASLAPRQSDVAWFVFFIDFFSSGIGIDNLSGFPSAEEAIAHYQERSRVELADMDWWITWACFRHSIVMARIAKRLEGEGIDVPGLSELDNFASRMLAERLGLPAPS